jgi:hypothetical protein
VRDATLNKGGHALTAVQVMEQSMMWFYGRAAYEQAKPEGDRNEKTMREDLLRAAKIAADVASYQQAKLTRTVLTGDSEGGPIPVSMTGELAVVIKGGLPFDPQATPPATASAPVDTTPPTE